MITSTMRSSTTTSSIGLSSLHQPLGRGRSRKFFAGGTGESRILLIMKIVHVLLTRIVFDRHYVSTLEPQDIEMLSVARSRA